MTIRIAYICADPGIPVFGTKGASVHVQEIIRAWRSRGAQVHLYCVRTGDHVPEDLRDLPVTTVPVDKGDVAQRERAQAQAAATLADRVLADGVDLVYERYSLFSAALAQVVNGAGVPGVLEVNAPLIEEQAAHRDLADVEGAMTTLRRQVTAAASVACVSRPVASWVRGHLAAGESAEHVVVVPNGVNTARITPARAAIDPADGSQATVLFVGTLKPWHGTEVLIEAAALRSTDWMVRIVGDGPQRAALEELALELDVPVQFVGAVPPQQIPAAMKGAAVAVAPYPQPVGPDAHYFSPLKVVEYAAAALPVVASRVGQVPDMLQDGHLGVLVPPSDPVALAAAIDALVADPERAAELGDRARADAVVHRSWPAVLSATLAPLAGRSRGVAAATADAMVARSGERGVA